MRFESCDSKIASISAILRLILCSLQNFWRFQARDSGNHAIRDSRFCAAKNWRITPSWVTRPKWFGEVVSVKISLKNDENHTKCFWNLIRTFRAKKCYCFAAKFPRRMQGHSFPKPKKSVDALFRFSDFWGGGGGVSLLI